MSAITLVAIPASIAGATGQTVTGVKLSVKTLPPAGGPVLVSATPSFAATCSLAVSPAGSILPVPVKCAGGSKVSLKLFVPALSSAKPLTFKIAVKACANGNCVTSAAVSLTQWANRISFKSTSAPWGTPVAASCPTASYCAVADGSAYLTIKSGKKYRRVLMQQGRLLGAVACASATMCVAGDVNGDGFALSGTARRKDITVSLSSKADKVVSACSASRCVVVWTHVTSAGLPTPVNVESVWNGTSWSAPVNFSTPGRMTAVACPPTGTACGAVDDAGNFTLFGDGLPAVFTKLDASGGPFNSIACPSVKSCLIGGQSSMVARRPFARGKTTTTISLRVQGTHPVLKVSCAADLTCFVSTAVVVAIAIGDLNQDGAQDVVIAGSTSLPHGSTPLIVAIPGQVTQIVAFGKSAQCIGHVTVIK